jgi:Holliday junction DNA helicase RuvA
MSLSISKSNLKYYITTKYVTFCSPAMSEGRAANKSISQREIAVCESEGSPEVSVCFASEPEQNAIYRSEIDLSLVFFFYFFGQAVIEIFRKNSISAHLIQMRTFNYSGEMYESIRGKVSHLTPEYAVLEVGGIGYKIYIPVNLYTSVLQSGAEFQLFTSLVVREDDMKLFGFISRKDRELFELITSISGIGAKTAISIIGHIPIHDLHMAIETKNIPKLCKIPGIGKKSAERLTLELKDRIKIDTALPIKTGLHHELLSDASLALIRLGYNQKAVEAALKKAMDSASEEPPNLPRLITSALKHI